MRLLPILLFCAVVLAGCNPTDRSDLQRDASQLGKTASRAAANATVAGKVETALDLRKGVSIKNLHVDADGSTVTIGGHVGSDQERKTVLDVANNTIGVDKVIDKMKVEPAATANPSIGNTTG